MGQNQLITCFGWKIKTYSPAFGVFLSGLRRCTPSYLIGEALLLFLLSLVTISNHTHPYSYQAVFSLLFSGCVKVAVIDPSNVGDEPPLALLRVSSEVLRVPFRGLGGLWGGRSAV